MWLKSVMDVKGRTSSTEKQDFHETAKKPCCASWLQCGHETHSEALYHSSKSMSVDTIQILGEKHGN